MIAQQKIRIEEYNYPLPAEKIAYFPAGSRDQSQLLVHKDGTITDATFKDLAQFLGPNDVLAFNNSRVIHARLLVQNRNGAAIEIFCLEPLAPTREIQEAFVQTCRVSWKCFVGNAKRWKEPIEFTVEVNQKPITITAVKGENSDGAIFHIFSFQGVPCLSYYSLSQILTKINYNNSPKRELPQTLVIFTLQMRFTTSEFASKHTLI